MPAVTDYYPNKDGYIEDGHVIAMCKAEDVTMTAGSLVALGAHVQNYVTVKTSDAVKAGDAVGMCLRAPVAINDTVPVCFTGVVKAVAYEALAAGALVSSALTTLNTVADAITDQTSVNLVHNGGTAHILGMTMQASATAADEILVFFGKFC